MTVSVGRYISGPLHRCSLPYFALSPDPGKPSKQFVGRLFTNKLGTKWLIRVYALDYLYRVKIRLCVCVEGLPNQRIQPLRIAYLDENAVKYCCKSICLTTSVVACKC